MASLQVLSGLLMIIKGIFSTSFFCLLLWSAACKKQEHSQSMVKNDNISSIKVDKISFIQKIAVFD